MRKDYILPDWLLYTAMFLAMGCQIFHVIGFFDRFPGDLFDARFNQFILEHIYRWTQGRVEHLADPPFFYPYRDMLYFSDTHFGTAAFYCLARLLGAPREVAFDLWFLSGLALTFVATAYVLRQFGLRTLSACAGACLFTFALPAIQIFSGHVQFAQRAGVPLATLVMVRLVNKPSLRQIFLLVLWVSWQFLCSVYMGIFLVEMLAIIALVAIDRPSIFPQLEIQERTSGIFEIIALGILAAIIAGLASYMLFQHWHFAHMYSVKSDIGLALFTAPRWSTFLFNSSPFSFWMNAWLPPPRFGDDLQLFIGFGTLCLAIIGVRSYWNDPKYHRLIILCFVIVIVFLLTIVDFFGLSLSILLSFLPVFSVIRSWGRVSLVFTWPIAFLAALGIEKWQKSHKQCSKILISLALTIALLDIAFYPSEFTYAQDSRTSIRKAVGNIDYEALQKKHAVLFHFLGDGSSNTVNTDLMLAAQDLDLVTINGYSRAAPPLPSPRTCEEAKIAFRVLDTLPLKREGANNIAARTFIVPPQTCSLKQ